MGNSIFSPYADYREGSVNLAESNNFNSIASYSILLAEEYFNSLLYFMHFSNRKMSR